MYMNNSNNHSISNTGKYSSRASNRCDELDFIKMSHLNNSSVNSAHSTNEEVLKQNREYSIRRKTDTYSPYSSRNFPSLRQNSLLNNINGSNSSSNNNSNSSNNTITNSASSVRTKKSYKSMLEQSSQFSITSNSSSWRNENGDECSKPGCGYLDQFKPTSTSSELVGTNRNKSKMEAQLLSKSSMSSSSGHHNYHPLYHGSTVIRLTGGI